jgi:hypothetical protein
MTRLVVDPLATARRRRALGWSLACEPVAPSADVGRDVVLRDRGDGRRDLALVEGPANLAQGLQIALTTGLGTDPFDIGFGFDGLRALAEETDPLLVRERVRVAVAQVLRRDPRVQRIVDVTLSTRAESPDARRTLRIDCTFEAVGGDPVGVVVDSALAIGVTPHG